MSELRRINSMPDPVQSQVASIRRTEIIELRNRLKELLRQVEAQAAENTVLKGDRAMFDTALAKYDGGKSDCSVTRENHRREMHQLKIELRKDGRKCRTLDQMLRSTEDELREMKELLRKYRDLIDQEKLDGAETLAERLRQNEDSISEMNLQIQDLQIEIESLTLSQQEEIKSEKLKNRQARKQVQDLTKELQTTAARLKEASKEIDLKNFRNFQSSSTSVGTLPSKFEKPHPPMFALRGNSDSLLSSHQKAKLYAGKQQALQRRKRKSFLDVGHARQKDQADMN